MMEFFVYMTVGRIGTDRTGKQLREEEVGAESRVGEEWDIAALVANTGTMHQLGYGYMESRQLRSIPRGSSFPFLFLTITGHPLATQNNDPERETKSSSQIFCEQG
ncbi:MAG: hypothetical protein JWQ42_2372 [Edaphobacter sp.]|nr:hypothetical protein [Edaphobacter sp.]